MENPFIATAPWMVGFVLWHINLFGSFNAESSHFDKFQTI